MGSATTHKHKSQASKSVKTAVITISDSKFEYLWKGDNTLEETEDSSGKLLTSSLEEKGHSVLFYTIIPDHSGIIKEMVGYISNKYRPDIIITTGGTGISNKDVTIETLGDIYTKNLEGFGEFFRDKSREEIGDAAMLTRASAGVIEDTLVFSLPGSPNACKVGLELIVEEAGHLVKHLKE